MKIISNAANNQIPSIDDSRMTSSSSPTCVICKHHADFELKSKRSQEEFHDSHSSNDDSQSSPFIRVRQEIFLPPPPAPAGLPLRSCLKSSKSSRTETLRRYANVGEEIEIVLPGAKRPITRRVSVQFNEGVMVRKMRPTKTLTDKPEQLWFTDAELERIKKQVMQLVEDKKRYAELQDEDDDDDDSVQSEEEIAGECTRGLERMLEAEKAKVMKFQAWDTVCNEQFLQRKEKDFDADGLAQVYGYVTRRSVREALKRAEKDREVIQAYLRSTRRSCRKQLF